MFRHDKRIRYIYIKHQIPRCTYHGLPWGLAFSNLSSTPSVEAGFFWEQSQGWPFKTVENFCPITCGCDTGNSDNTGCPQPLDLSCEAIIAPGSRCITYNQPLN